jgi:hypothetical protein
MTAFTFKWVSRYDPSARLLRLCRWMWVRGEVGTDKGGYSTKLSLALHPTIFRVSRARDGWMVTVLGVRLHKQRSYGGIYV